MKRSAIAIVALLLAMSVPTGLAQIPAPNDNTTVQGNPHTLSIDGYVTTKFASVGSEVQIMALTRGHSANTIVTAEIEHYPNMDVIDLISTVSLPEAGEFVDTVVLTQSGPHEDDANTMVWEGVYTIPVSALGGVYGAAITAEDGNLRVTDDPTQLGKVLREEIELVLAAVDNAWERSNPTLDIKGEFDELDDTAVANGGWSVFVATSRDGAGLGGSAQLWDAMIAAGHNQYNMSEGANFLEALMDLLDSDDIDASLAMITGLMVYMNEFPLPRTLDDFDEMVDYMLEFDPVANFSRFEGTADFAAAYDALLGSSEYVALREALDNLANGTKKFKSIQTILHNLALLAVSDHPEAILDALEAWAEPLIEGDFDSMTPVQKFLVRWIEMADKLNEETDIQDLDDDGAPERITWQYEYLLETNEGQAWTAKMEADDPWVNDIMDDFNQMPEDIIGHVFESISDPIWDGVGETAAEFLYWAENASRIERHMNWYPPEEGEEGGTEDGVNFEELYDISTSVYDPHVLDLGLELRFWGPEDDTDYPASFTMTATNDRGDDIQIILNQADDDRGRYLGRFTAINIEDTSWEFSQPMSGYSEEVDHAEFRMEGLRESMLDMLVPESVDEVFLISAVGVLVEQDETISVDSPYTVNTLTYDHEGAVEGAEVDIAILRISPQQAEIAFAQFESEGEVELSLTSTRLSGQYSGSDLVGDVDATISSLEWDEERGDHPQAAPLEDDIEISGMGTYWEKSDLPSGLVEVTTIGTVDTGLEFEFTQQIPLPGTSGCARVEAHSGERWAHLNWHYEEFRIDGDEDRETTYFDKPGLSELTIDWGDGSSVDEHSENGNSEDGWQSHDYSENDPMWAMNEYDITIAYTDENGVEVNHYLNYKPNEGYDFDGERRGYLESGWCNLDMESEFTPSAEIIDAFITDGPGEVMDEQIFTSDADGTASMLVSPSLPGFYITIVQSEVVNDDGDTMTGIGLNLNFATAASVSIGGLVLETTIAGIPVYSVTPGPSGLASLTVIPTGVEADAYTAELVIAPLELTVPFPDIDSDIWNTQEEYELDFQSGDTERTQEVRITAPLSLILATVMTEDSDWPEAVHMGVLMSNPGGLNLTGDLGPGQTTNIALDEATGEATRILAFAAPSNGFDPASIDFSAITELIWAEGLKADLNWISSEAKVDDYCIGMRVEEQDWGMGYNVHISLQHSQGDWASTQHVFDPSGARLADGQDASQGAVDDWSELEWEENTYESTFDLDLDTEDTFTLGLDEMEWTFDVIYDEDDDAYYLTFEENNEGRNWVCSGDGDMTDEEEFAMFDDFFASLDSVAWGLGSSADLRLPILASPQDSYTVIAVAQTGSGASAEVIAAFDSIVAQPNPEPPMMENLTLSFSPANPRPGDIVAITAIDEDLQVVADLSVTLVRDNITLFGLLTDEDGQARFGVTIGTIVVRVSGGMYNPAELTIIVSEDGIVTEDGEDLPTDTDGDGAIDSEDAFPNDPDETSDTDNDGVGDNEDLYPLDPDKTGVEVDEGDGNKSELGTDSGSDWNSTFIIAGAVVALLLMAAVILFVMRRRSGGDGNVWDDNVVQADDLFDEPVIATAPPSSGPPPSSAAPREPAPSAVGEMRDGYEVIEHPVGSGEWWWKDAATGRWNEWT